MGSLAALIVDVSSEGGHLSNRLNRWTNRKPVAIGSVLGAGRQVYGPAVQPLQSLKRRAVIPSEQSLRHMQPVVGVDANKMGVNAA